MLPDVVRIADICAFMGVSEATVRLWVRRKKIPPPTAISYHFRIWDRSQLLPHLDDLKARV